MQKQSRFISFKAAVAAAGVYLTMLTLSAQGQPLGGITATAGVDFKGNNVWMDSFDSTDPGHSVWQTNLLFHGQPYGIWSNSMGYFTSPSRTDHVTVATDGSIINIGNAKIYGYVNTAPGGTVAVSSGGSIGDATWVSGGATGLEAGHALFNMNKVFFSKPLPSPITPSQTTWWPVPAVTTNIGGITYSYVITNKPGYGGYVYYAMNRLTASLFINASNVVLYFTNGITLGGSAALTLNTNANVQIYTGGDVTTAGSGNINNLTLNGRALQWYDIAGCPVTFTFGGNGFGTGWVYAPGSSIRFAGGGGSSRCDVVGAIFCHDIVFNGNYSFHFDESLVAPSAPWIVSQPTNRIVAAGSNATVAVTTLWSPAITNYQWYFNETTLLPGATNASLTLTNVQLTDAGVYSVVVTNVIGAVTSALASLVVYTDATPVLSAPIVPADGSFQFSIAGVTGLNYVVQGSTNLADWVSLRTNLSPFLFTDLDATNYSQRFYRAVLRP